MASQTSGTTRSSGADDEPSRALSDLLDTVRGLWPDAPVRLARDDASDGRVLIPMPNPSQPRMMVPEGRRAAAGALRRYSSALSLRETATRTAAASATRVLGPKRLVGGTRVIVGDSPDSISSHLAEVFSQPVDVSITIGPERANRKPILQIFSATGATIGFAKLGTTDETRDVIAREGRALRELQGRFDDIELPEVIELGAWRNTPILVMSALRTRPQRPRPDDPPLAHMARFSRAFGHEVTALRDCPQWRRVRDAVAAEHPLGGLLTRIEEIAEPLPEVVVGCWHGDWTSWNMARSGDRLQLCDLERFERGAVDGLDAFHFLVNRETRSRGTSRETIMDGVVEAHRRTGASPMTRLVGAVYLAVISERYLAAASGASADLVSERLDACLTALREWVR